MVRTNLARTWYTPVGSENDTARLLFVVVFECEQGYRSTEITDFCANVIAHGRIPCPGGVWYEVSFRQKDTERPNR